MSKAQVERYSRQLLLPSFGVDAQARVCRARVAIVGCGGLGAPAALYLAAAGVAALGLIDHDTVELSNMHRQIIHTEARVGVHKALSAAAAVSALNSGVRVELHVDGLTAENAVQLLGSYDVVLDCSDNPPTRYLVSDACVALGVPLVSAAAVGTDGQLTVYAAGGDCPCYRCLFPEPPAPENCSRCADAGVLGVVPGILGTMQALECIKLVAGVGEPLARRLLLFDGLAGRATAVKLRPRSPACAACGDAPSVTRESISRFDYVAFTGQAATDGPPQPLKLLPAQQRVAPRQLWERLAAAARGECGRPVLLDVRPALQHAALALPGSVNVPFSELEARLDEVVGLCGEEEGEEGGTGAGAGAAVFVLCRRGNDSQRAVAALRAAGVGRVVDVIGGMQAWARDVDPSMPLL